LKHSLRPCLNGNELSEFIDSVFRRAQTSGKGYKPRPALIDNQDPANKQVRRDQQEFMERAMRIEPTSEGWEARSKNQALELAALSKFGEASNGK